MSTRKGKPFVAVNCAALPGELIESELFGAEKGAYTGAGAARQGRFERADGGTLMLDELGELPLPAQAKLLRVLQHGEIERLASTQPRKVDVRVAGFTDRALDVMRSYPWPGNVRELENLIERGVILASTGETVDVHELFPTLPGTAAVTVNAAGQLERAAPSGSEALYDDVMRRDLSLDELEDALIQKAVRRADGNLAAAARALGLTRPPLSYRLQRVRDRAKD